MASIAASERLRTRNLRGHSYCFLRNCAYDASLYWDGDESLECGGNHSPGSE